MTRTFPALVVALCAFGALPTAATGQPCVPHLSDQFDDGYLSGRIRTMLVRETPGGAELYAGGDGLFAYPFPDSVAAARWDGGRWTPLLRQLPGAASSDSTRVYALTIFDDGSGPALYAGAGVTLAGSQIIGSVVRWDGTAWSAVGSGFNNEVRALKGFDDGSGPALYAAGYFTQAGGHPSGRIARWTAGTWIAVGSGVAGTGTFGHALEVFDDGRGPALYLGGQFTMVDGVPASNVARWDGRTWSALGAGATDWVATLSALDLGTGPALYAGGAFASAGGVAATRRIARWDSNGWSELGGGLDTDVVTAIAPFGDGAGSVMYAAATTGIAYRWDGVAWAPAAAGQTYWPGASRCLAVYPGAQGPALVIGGEYAADWGYGFLSHRRRGGDAWQTGMTDASVSLGTASVLALGDDASGPALYVAGAFESAGGAYSPGLARYSAAGWSAVGLPPGINVQQAAAFNDGVGEVLCVTGYPNAPGAFQSMAVSEHGTWSFPSGSFGWPLAAVRAGPAAGLYAVRLNPAAVVVRTPGGWANVGVTLGGGVSAMTALDDGSGQALFALGDFQSINGVPTSGVAAWNGAAWRGFGLGSTGSGQVRSGAMFDDGSGLALYVAGTFTQIGGVPCQGVARWRAGAWSAVPAPAGAINALQTFDDGTGPALYAAGQFQAVPGDTRYAALARWYGGAWSSVGGPVRGFSGALALAAFDEGSGPALWGAGAFEMIGDVQSARVAKWVACRGPGCYANCDQSTGRAGQPTLNALDFACFQEHFAAGHPYANCDGSVTAYGAPALNVADFVCFMQRFAAGCP